MCRCDPRVPAMNNRLSWSRCRWAVVLAAVAWISADGSTSAHAVPAFPGAEGFGAEATGGRGGHVVYVTNLDDDGPGSFRDAVAEGNRTVLFQVSGTIRLSSTLTIRESNITVAGQTAPGDGICLRGKELLVRGDNIIIRFLRLRPGDELGQEHDSLTIRGSDRFVIDHCSMSWSVDSVNDVVRNTTRGTVQWCIVSEPLNDSVHSKGPHGYGTGWGSGRSAGNSYHHNLIAHCNSRSPRIGSEPRALVDVRNNVIYNMGSGWAYGGERARINYVGNYYKPGPSTTHPHELFRVSTRQTRMYLQDNIVEGQPDVTANNADGLIADGETIDLTATVVRDPFAVPPVTTDSAADAYELVLRYSGAVLPRRDAVDQRVIADVRQGTGRIIDSQSEVGGWPELQSAAPPLDSDGDGLPDPWELAHQLDPQEPSDSAQLGSSGYTRLEQYLHELAAAAVRETGDGRRQ